MFKFEFNQPKSDSSKLPPPPAQRRTCDHDEKPAAKINITDDDISTFTNQAHHIVCLSDDDDGDTLLIRKSEATVPCHLSPKGEDIVPEQYEGGYKLWEGAVDLGKYIYKNKQTVVKSTASSENIKVLELGAGHAFPSIIICQLLNMKCELTVHDYNEQVIKDITAPNIHANCPSVRKVNYYCGSWSSLQTVLNQHEYDIIITAETVYTEQHLQSLANCVLKLLKPDGVGYVCGKSYYFGVGGGMLAFKNQLMLTASGLNLNVNAVKVQEIRDGSSNVREILKITKV